ncbi:unnamed protein product [Camellia sinensis]
MKCAALVWECNSVVRNSDGTLVVSVGLSIGLWVVEKRSVVVFGGIIECSSMSEVILTV